MPLEFETVSQEHKSNYLNSLNNCPVKTSDYSFINLWGWSGEYGLVWSRSQDIVWIKQTKPHELFWPPVGNWEVIDWKKVFSNAGFKKIQFVRIPEMLLDVWKNQLGDWIFFEEDRDQWDYIYDCRELINLAGNRFHKKKNLLNQFQKRFDFRYMDLEKEIIGQVLAMQSEWCQWKDCDLNDALASENRVIEKVLSGWNDLDHISGGVILVENDIVAYTVAEFLTDDTLLIHFEKANQVYPGAYQAINQMYISSIRRHSGKNLKWINRMQDLGNKGLRKAKLSYHPVDFNRKYFVSITVPAGKIF